MTTNADVQLVRTKLEQVSRELRAFCASTNYRGDRLACANSADVADAFLAKQMGPTGLYTRALAGDAAAAQQWVTGGSRLIESLTGTPGVFKDNTVTDLVEKVATDVKQNAGKIGAGIGAGIGLGMVVPLLGVAFVALRGGKK